MILDLARLWLEVNGKMPVSILADEKSLKIEFTFMNG